MIKRTENDTTYICLTPWFRLIFRNGKYCGWYNPRLKKVLD